jgi:CheY-like chemotaxis protein
VREITQACLEEAGFSVTLAANAAEAIAALERDRSRDFLGLVTDIRLGGSQSGWDVAHRARELNPGLPIIYVTGDSGHEWSAKGVPHSTLITKPFACAQIVTALATLLNRVDDED